MLLFVLARLWVLMTEDEMSLDMTQHKSGSSYKYTKDTNLCAWASEVRTKHDNPGSLVIEFLSASMEAIFEQFDVSAATITAFLVLHLILNDKWVF
jgi:hypothetical protein